MDWRGCVVGRRSHMGIGGMGNTSRALIGSCGPEVPICGGG